MIQGSYLYTWYNTFCAGSHSLATVYGTSGSYASGELLRFIPLCFRSQQAWPIQHYHHVAVGQYVFFFFFFFFFFFSFFVGSWNLPSGDGRCTSISPRHIWPFFLVGTGTTSTCPLSGTHDMEVELLEYLHSIGRTPVGWEEVLFG